MTDVISPLPFTLQNGTTADASQVMADLSQIRGDVNSNDILNNTAITQPHGTNNTTIATTAFIQEAILMATAYKGAALYAPSVTVNIGTNDLVFTQVLEDSGSIASGLSTLTVPTGTSIVRIKITVEVTGGGTTAISLNKNGIVFAPGVVYGGVGLLLLDAPISVNVGDAFTISITQTGGSTIVNIPTTFEMQLIG